MQNALRIVHGELHGKLERLLEQLRRLPVTVNPSLSAEIAVSGKKQTASRCDELYDLFLEVVDVKGIVTQDPLRNAMLAHLSTTRLPPLS